MCVCTCEPPQAYTYVIAVCKYSQLNSDYYTIIIDICYMQVRVQKLQLLLKNKVQCPTVIGTILVVLISDVEDAVCGKSIKVRKQVWQ